MQKLLAALEAFAKNPGAVGDNLFTTFSVITHMSWEEALAAGSAIKALKNEAWETAEKTKGSNNPQFSSLKNPVVMRLRECLAPVIMRIGQLIAEAPRERQAMLLESVKSPHGFVDLGTAQNWQEKLGLAKSSD